MITPPIFRVNRMSGNAEHKAFFIRIKKGIERFDSVLAQEIYEWRWLALRSWPVAIAASTAFWLLVSADLTLKALVTSILVTLVVSMAYRVAPLTREMEFRGHAVEVAHAERFYEGDTNALLEEEARALLNYPQFKGWDFGHLKDGIRDRLPMAREWVDKNY